ncbi:hypothetical protein AKJ16_DCAP03110 [Drosera capensis]
MKELLRIPLATDTIAIVKAIQVKLIGQHHFLWRIILFLHCLAFQAETSDLEFLFCLPWLSNVCAQEQTDIPCHISRSFVTSVLDEDHEVLVPCFCRSSIPSSYPAFKVYQQLELSPCFVTFNSIRQVIYHPIYLHQQ